MHVCVCACARACVRACVRAWACVRYAGVGGVSARVKRLAYDVRMSRCERACVRARECSGAHTMCVCAGARAPVCVRARVTQRVPLRTEFARAATPARGACSCVIVCNHARAPPGRCRVFIFKLSVTRNTTLNFAECQ